MAGRWHFLLGWFIISRGYVRFRECNRATKHLASDNSKTCWSISWSKSCWKEALARQVSHEGRFWARLLRAWERQNKYSAHSFFSHPPKKSHSYTTQCSIYLGALLEFTIAIAHTLILRITFLIVNPNVFGSETAESSRSIRSCFSPNFQLTSPVVIILPIDHLLLMKNPSPCTCHSKNLFFFLGDCRLPTYSLK